MSNRTEPNDDETTESCTEKPTPQPLTNLTGFKRDQLFVIRKLAESNPHGLVIKDTLDCYYDEEISQGRLYKNLGELVDEGYVEKHPLDGRTNAYRPSTRANERLEEHHEWERECLFHDR
ncbi:helix-turn-helix transcriptional regulator [Halobiforma nitratireducens]|uniref:Transcription regulator n=1 Tax=Halobiforma nitratireducens JCM 10879 TaxID=1227454 RepID=M0LWU1_9EURY|nr:helix-turn-helix transcriptional regulator [Halobiforma nitratireducens]EMA36839.1 transcription regulator [Halobiforma nitratireducens JCM 10879]